MRTPLLCRSALLLSCTDPIQDRPAFIAARWLLQPHYSLSSQAKEKTAHHLPPYPSPKPASGWGRIPVAVIRGAFDHVQQGSVGGLWVQCKPKALSTTPDTDSILRMPVTATPPPVCPATQRGAVQQASSHRQPLASPLNSGQVGPHPGRLSPPQSACVWNQSPSCLPTRHLSLSPVTVAKIM